jgi:hypothetical protein
VNLDRGTDGNELSGVLAPFVVVDVKAHTDDAVGTEFGRFFFHARHGQLARVVHRLGEFGQLLTLAPFSSLDARVIDGRTHNETNGMKSDFFDQQEFIHRQV